MTGMVAVEASRYAGGTHAYCSKPRRSAMILGSAVPTMVWSSATRNSASMSPATASTTPRPPASPSARPNALSNTHLLLHGLGERAEHPPQLPQLFFVEHGVDAAVQLLVERRPLLQHAPSLGRQVHAHHAFIVGVALATDQTLPLHRLRGPGDPRGVHLVVADDLTLAPAVLPREPRQ